MVATSRASAARGLLRRVHIDVGLLLIVLAILIVGLVMVYSASYGFALLEGGQYEGQPAYFVRRQGIFAVVGLVSLVVLSQIDYHLYQKLAVWVLAATVLLLLVTLVVVWQRPESLGRWLTKTRSIQPAEAAKLGAIIYIAVWLADMGDALRTIRLGLLPFALLLGFISGLIMLQPDFSTSVLLVATATAMFFVAGADMRQLLIGFLGGGFVLMVMAMVFPYRMERINLWLESPFRDATDKGFQIIQTLVALSKGGVVGAGLGQSQQKFAIYAPHSDCIYAIIGEETGLFGALLVLGLYGLWTWRGLRIAWNAPDLYGRLLAAGIVCWVTFQAILHIAVITNTMPFTGTVLPFISSGGSSLVSCLASVGVLLSISRAGSRASLSVPSRAGPA